ncbi:MAG TPA: hypothetical protein VLB90_01505 [Pseudomonadales bacterium]|nr:hypothetical protein [Pseudomonadales bacterium]
MLTATIKEKTFNRCLIGCFFTVVVGMAVFNFIVNPFGVFPAKPIPGYTDVHFIENVRIYKNFLIKNRAIDGLMLGSSRIEESMNPLPAAWPNMQVYNMAMPGASLHEILRNLQHANAVTPLKQGLIGLDFFMFSAFMGSVSDYSEDYFSVDASGNKKPDSYVLRTYANLLFSADALEKSRDTINDSKKHAAPSHDDNGMVAIAAHNAAAKDNAAIYKVFDAFENNYFRKNSFWLNGPDSTYTTIKNAAGESTYDDLRAMLDYIYRNNLDIRFVISPIHVHMLLGLDGIGLWPAFCDWKKQLAKINEEVAATYHQPPKPIWDFAIVNDMTTELLPADPRLPAPKNGLQWFWDPAHAKPAFGDLVQQHVFISGTEDIGTILRSNTIDNHLQQQTAALNDYKEKDPVTRDAIQKRLESLNTWHWIKQTPEK